ncbi:hypothetical protein [Nostoc sp.]
MFWAVQNLGGWRSRECQSTRSIRAADITHYRDFNKDFKRTGDKLDTGLFGVNQHWGYRISAKMTSTTLQPVVWFGRSRNGHREFMSLIKRDRR